MHSSIEFPEAIRIVCDTVKATETEIIPLSSAFGRILAEDVTAAEDVPSFERSPYDGYALRASDLAVCTKEHPVTLRVIENIAAGEVPTRIVTTGTAVRVMTGAPVPEGADAVVMFEKTSFTDTEVTFFETVASGDNVIRIGEDIKKGTVLAGCGQPIDAGLMGSVAAQNRSEVLVFRRPVIGLISTGSELIPVGQEAGPGMIHDSNRYTLSGALEKLGCQPVSYGIAGDSTESIAAKLETALQECDTVILTGGVSVGDYDLTPAAMEAVGAEIFFRGCNIKPGMACAYGQRNGKLICALSGNPASSITNFHLIARPALEKLSGRKKYLPDEITVTLANAFGKKSPSTRLLRGKMDLSDGSVRMILPKDQGNVVISSTIGCDLMAIVPAGSEKLEAGTQLKGFLL